MGTIVYLKGGDTYLGELENRHASLWKKFGKDRKQKYMYKGYRYWENKKAQVVVFDNKKWSDKEIAKRRANGFLGIKTYKL